MPKSGTAKKTTEKEDLLKNLRALIKDIDEEGLLFLIKQANVLIYNKRVDELNKKTQSASDARGVKKNVSGNNGPLVAIESGRMGKTFILVIENERKMLGEKELISLVKIAHSAESQTAACERLFRWLELNRDDIILDTGLKPKGEKIKALYAEIISRFELKK